MQAVKENPSLKFLVDCVDNGEMSVNEANRIIEHSEDESEKRGKLRKLKEQVMKEDGNKCRKCGNNLHLDVHTITPFHDKDKLENLETLCKDCYESKKRLEEEDEEDILTKEFHLLEAIAGLTMEQIFGMEIGEFLVKYRQFYHILLQGLSVHDIHLQAKTLDYLLPTVRDMLELTEAKRSSLKKQEDSGIGSV